MGSNMFGVDSYSASILVPSLIGIAGMTAVMVWGFFKIKKLMNEDSPK